MNKDEYLKYSRFFEKYSTPAEGIKKLLIACCKEKEIEQITNVVREVIDDIDEFFTTEDVVDSGVLNDVEKVKEALEEFSDDICTAINNSRDWDDFWYLVPEAIEINCPWDCGNEKEIKAAIRNAVEGSYSHLIEGVEDAKRQVVNNIWEVVEKQNNKVVEV